MIEFLSSLGAAGDLATAFEILALGWGGIFVVMILIYVISMALVKFFPPSKEA